MIPEERRARIKAVVDKAPPLTAEQRNRLRELLEPVRIYPKVATAPNQTMQAATP